MIFVAGQTQSGLKARIKKPGLKDQGLKIKV
jgi:hypothetical protein